MFRPDVWKCSKNVVVEANGAARARMFDQTSFIERKNFRVFFCQPQGRRGGGRAQHDLDVMLRHDVHHAAQPEEIVLALLRLANAQENSPMRTTLMPALAISSASRSQTPSGLSAVPA